MTLSLLTKPLPCYTERRNIKREEKEVVNIAASDEGVIGIFFVYFLAGLVAPFMILRENWIRKQIATEVRSRLFTKLAPILLI